MSEALSCLALSDDGHIVLGPDATVTALDDEATRLLGIERALPRAFAEIATDLQGWADVLRAVAEGQRTDIYLRGPTGRRLLASLRRAPGTGHVGLVELRDLDQFDYRRDRALGVLSEVPLRSTVENRTRPDFATQRRLSPALNRLLSRGERAIRQGARILITGESGVGKSEIARFLHAVVADARDPFVIVNCATDSATDLDAALFAPDGLIEQAMGGTLFLDEVAEIPLSVQARLLGFLEDGVARNTGPRRDPPLRLIAATNAELQALVREGRFRSDLYYRIAVIGLAVPPLRQMPDLIGHLTDRFLQTINQRRVTPVILPRRLRDLLGRLRLSRQHPRAFEHHPARCDLHGRRDRYGRAVRRIAGAGARRPRSDRGCVAGSAHRGSPVRTGADRQGDPHPWQQAQGGQGAGRGYRHHRQKDG